VAAPSRKPRLASRIPFAAKERGLPAQ
jgi:hypothetical protein